MELMASKLLDTKTKKKKHSLKNVDLDSFMESMDWADKTKKTPQPDVSTNINKTINDLITEKNILDKSVIKSGFEKLKKIKEYNPTDKKLKERRKRIREKTKGKKWFGLPATEMTDEIKHDLEVVQMRSVLDPKRFYKKNDLKTLPKYFQIGKVMDAPQDYYSSRLTNKERKRTLVDELMADAEFAKFNKRKYKEIISKQEKTNYKAKRRAQKTKRKNK